MTRRFALPLIACAGTLLAQIPPIERPKLVLLIAVDQLRYDYLTRFRQEYSAGFKTLLERGANFTNAHLEHYPTVTAIGHSTMMTGATPALSGIIGNDWYDRESGKQVTSVSDDGQKLLGAAGKASSPHRLLVGTVGDEMKRAGLKSKVIGVSMKDRAAILPSGRSADGAYWFNDKEGAFVSSTWYFKELPGWVTKWNGEKQADQFAGKTWAPGRTLPATPGPGLNAAVYGSSFGNHLLEAFAERALEAEQLGQRGATDLLTVSFSSNDSVGHSRGPDSPEVQAITIDTDLVIGRLLEKVNKLVGLDKTIVILTADHGVGPNTEVLLSEKMPGGRLTNPQFFGPVQTALESAFGPGQWITATAGSSPYFNYALIAEKKVAPGDVQRVAAQAMYAQPHVSRVYTRQQILDGRFAADRFDLRVVRSFYPQRSGDLEVVLDPYWVRGRGVATHGSPYLYDSHIPLIIMGPGLRPGRYVQEVALNDLAPTLATILDIETPAGSVGRVLVEALRP